MNPEIRIAVASHKPYWMPSDSMYLPVQVGAKGKGSIPGFQRDDSGDSLSEKNPRYCELTALYWMWKNFDAEYIGLAHYRRHFRGSGDRGVFSSDDAANSLKRAPVVLPSKRHYFIENVESHYAHTFDQAHIDIVRQVLSERSPDVLPFFNQHMKSRSAHIWNMAIMRKDILSEWCEWVFPILQEIENGIDFSEMSPFEERVIGRLSERLLDPWIARSDIRYVEQPVVSLEGENWAKKGAAFLKAKFFGKTYGESF